MSGKSIAVGSIGLAIVAGLLYFMFLRESSVSGRVTWEGKSIAAGHIVFKSDDDTFTSQISDGQYEIRHRSLAGKYDVRIEIHFVNPEEAKHFYENLTKELNPGPDPEQHGDPESERDPEADDQSEEKLSSLKRFDFQETLSNGWNTRNYDLPPASTNNP